MKSNNINKGMWLQQNVETQDGGMQALSVRRMTHLEAISQQ